METSFYFSAVFVFYVTSFSHLCIPFCSVLKAFYMLKLRVKVVSVAKMIMCSNKHDWLDIVNRLKFFKT
jgi:hypothetical protein